MFTRIAFYVMLIVYVWARSPMPDNTTDQFETDCLNVHNHYRALHTNTGPLTLDPSIISYAKSRCNSVSQSDALSAGHSGLQLGTYGENLYWSGSSDGRTSSARDAIKAWYDEIGYYVWSNPTFSSATGHFTQLVWKGTTKLGCAMCGGWGTQWYETYVVCNYVDPGNVLGQFSQNVFTPINMPLNSSPQNVLNQNPGLIQNPIRNIIRYTLQNTNSVQNQNPIQTQNNVSDSNPITTTTTCRCSNGNGDQNVITFTNLIN